MAANLAVFAAEVRDRVAEDGVVRGYTPAVGESVPAPEPDWDAWFAWTLAANDPPIMVMMPDVGMARLCDLTASAPPVRVNRGWWWWNALQAYARMPVRLLTMDTSMALRARMLDLRVLKPTKDIGDEPVRPEPKPTVKTKAAPAR